MEDHSNKLSGSAKKRKRWPLAIVLALVVVLFVVAWLAQPALPDPIYEGKPLSSWLTNYDTNGLNWPRQANPADEAVRQIGIEVRQ